MQKSFSKQLSDCQMQHIGRLLDKPKMLSTLGEAVIRHRRPLFETGR